MKTSFNSILLILLFTGALSSFKLKAANNPDMSINRMKVYNIDDHSFTLDYTLDNNGFGQVSLSNIFCEVYLSDDDILNTGDKLVSKIEFNSNAPKVGTELPEYNVTKKFTTNESVSDYPFVIMVIKTVFGVYLPDNNHNNNIRSESMRYAYADLFPSFMKIESINKNSITFSCIISNAGNSPLHLDRFNYSVYVSPIGNLTSQMKLIGTKNFSPTPLTIEAGKNYSIQYSFDSPVSLKDYPFVVIQADLQPGKSQMERNTDNNFNLTYIGIPDMVVTDINPSNVNKSYINFNFGVGNAGSKTLDLKDFYYEVYLSADYVLTPAYDKFTKSGNFTINGSSLVGANTNYGPHFFDQIVTTGINLNTYHYLIVLVKNKPGIPSQETFLDNNYISENIIYDLSSTRIAANNYELSQQDNVLQVSQPEENVLSSYMLFTAEGLKIQEGEFNSKKEINTSGLKAGIYILRISNGANHECHKFIITE